MTYRARRLFDIGLISLAILGLIAIAPGAGIAFTILPDTGQTICFDQAGTEIPCPPPGDPLAQDGSYTDNPPSFTDNGDGTVTDNNTHLMWEKDDGIRYNWYEATGTADATYNPGGATDVCGISTVGGFSDWRLPSRRELISIVDYGEFQPAIDTSYFPNTAFSLIYNASPDYWVVNEDLSIYPPGVGAWHVISNSGGSGSNSQKTYLHYVRCVRGQPLMAPAFVSNEDGTITDNNTGLMWQQGDGGSMIWDSALGYCEGLSLGGKSDWRLPNVRELETITEPGVRADPAVDPAFFPNIFPNAHWTSTPRPDVGHWAFRVNLGTGSIITSDKAKQYQVRCVRGGCGNGSELAIVSFDSTDPVVANDNLTYTLTVSNNGPSVATAVTLSDTLPSAAAFVSATSTQGGCTESGGTVTCTLGDMNPGSNVIVTIVVTAPGVAGMMTNTASVAGSTNDHVLSNNSATEDTIVAPTAYTLNVSIIGSGTVSGAGIACPTDCGESLDVATDIALTANPDAGWLFDTWSGDLAGSSNPSTISVDGHKNVTAEFLTDADSDAVPDATDNCPFAANPLQADGDADGVGDSCEYAFPDTGQTTCYDGVGTVIACPVPDQPLAQDGSYTINAPSYTDNGDGTLADGHTGLMWQQQDDNVSYNWYEASGTEDATYNPGGSTNACGSLSIGGYSDWRLPTKKELLSIVNYEVSNPSIDSFAFPNTDSLPYWSITGRADFSSRAWQVEFAAGGVSGGEKTGAATVRCVRGDPFTPGVFTDNGDGTVTDRATGLVWQKSSSSQLSWETALGYCEGLSLGEGTQQWRLPNAKELDSITDESMSNPAMDSAYFPGSSITTPYWSSSSLTGSSISAWGVTLSGGSVKSENKSGYGYARCVKNESMLSADSDGDGVLDSVDNCPFNANPLQEDDDLDGPGNACDLCPLDPDNDIDGDGLCGDIDNCRAEANPAQNDSDGDGVGDICDNCPITANPLQEDSNGFGLGDACAYAFSDTGQVTCYDGSGTVIACPVPGDALAQDGSYAINTPAYTDNADGTVTDNNTGLMWQQQDDNVSYNWYEASGTANNPHNHGGSTDVCGSLSLGGYSDWRLPTKKELLSIVDYGFFNPAIDAAAFPDTDLLPYWSITGQADYSGGAWQVDFTAGSVLGGDKADTGRVRCVRGGPLTFGVFTANGDGTVTENATGLIWQRSSFFQTSWESALAYCEGLSLGAGTQTWRLPNAKELDSITDELRANPAIDTGYFPGSSSTTPYWSSTTRADDTFTAWGVTLGGGSAGISGRIKGFDKSVPGKVRCVKGGGSASSDSDGDGVLNGADNCPFTPNPLQEDGDLDGFGDDCDVCPLDLDNDTDGDGVCGDLDNCPADANVDQANSDVDGFGDVCDNCAFTANQSQADNDADGVGDACEYAFPDTGQTACYDGSGAVIACPVPGSQLAQDGSYTIDAPAYTDNADGTLTDNNTGLMWQQQDDNVSYNWYEASGTADATHNPGGSTDVCGSLSLGGYSDWRLPVKKELLSIVDYGFFNPAIDAAAFTNTDSLPYWSSTEQTDYAAGAWQADFAAGTVLGEEKTGTGRARCVRGDRLNFHVFTNNGDETVTDNVTGLIWQRTASYRTSWESALGYCEGLTFGGGTQQWRLPNAKELDSITDESKANPAIDKSFFYYYANTALYWSSTTRADNALAAWGMTLGGNTPGTSGRIGSADKQAGGLARCVKAGGDVSADSDGDGVLDGTDNCPFNANPLQEDGDLDGRGDTCDICPFDPDDDMDDDGICGDVDNCPSDANVDQTNADNDAFGDVCDICPLDPDNDIDADGVCGDVDNCPMDANNDQADADGDTLGDVCDICPFDSDNDIDADTVCGDVDNCPVNANTDQANADSDAFGNVCDICPFDPDDDIDGDGLCGDVDNCPLVPNPGQSNHDNDALGNVCDTCPLDPDNDIDGDGICGDADNCPVDANTDQADGDSDGVGDICDNCVFKANPAQADADGDGAGDFCEPFIAVGMGPGATNSSQIKVVGDTLIEINSFAAFDSATVSYGSRVATGDIDGDGYQEILVAKGEDISNNTEVKVYEMDGRPVSGANFVAFSNVYRKGARVASADFDGDGKEEIVVGTAATRPLVRILSFDEATSTIVDTGVLFNAFSGSGSGVNIAAADIDGDGVPELLTALSGNKGRPEISVWSVITTDGMGSWTVAPHGYSTSKEILQMVTARGVAVAADDSIVAVGTGATGGVVELYDGTGQYKCTIIMNEATTRQATKIELEIGDFDGNGIEEVLVGLGASSDSGTEVYIYDTACSALPTFGPVFPGEGFGTRLAVGRVQ